MEKRGTATEGKRKKKKIYERRKVENEYLVTYGNRYARKPMHTCMHARTSNLEFTHRPILG